MGYLAVKWRVKTYLAVLVLFAAQLLAAQTQTPAQFKANFEHMRNFDAYIQLQNYSAAVAEVAKMTGDPDRFPNYLPDLALAYDQLGKPHEALRTLERIRAKRKANQIAAAALPLVSKLERNLPKLKHPEVKAEFIKLRNEFPSTEKLREELTARAREFAESQAKRGKK